MARSSRSNRARASRKRPTKANSSSRARRDSSEEAIRAGERIALAAFSSGLKLAAAVGTVAAKTAGLALASLASGADRFSELVKEEALRSYNGQSSNEDSFIMKRRARNGTPTQRRKKPSR